MVEDHRVFGITGDWSPAALETRFWFNTVCEVGCRLMATWAREEEKASENQKRKREAEEADKVEVAPGAAVENLSRFRTALIGLTQEPPKRHRLCR